MNFPKQFPMEPSQADISYEIFYNISYEIIH